MSQPFTPAGPPPDAGALATPRRTSPWSALFGLVQPQQIRAFFPALVVAFTSGRAGYVLGALTVVSLVAGALSWWRRTWSFDGAVLHLDEGVLVRNERRIPIDRIQHVELERRVRHQALGLAAVRVETAGGSGSELSLDPVPLGQALALQTLVRAAATSASSDTVARPTNGSSTEVDGPLPPPPPPPLELIRLRPARLLLAGVTGPEVAAVFVGLGVGLDALTDLGVEVESLSERQLAPAALVVLGLVAIPLWFLTAGLIALVRKWDLRATLQGDELRVTYGLLRRQAFSMPTTRVRDVRVVQRLLLRPFRKADLRVHSAGSGSSDSSRVDIPLLDDDEIDRILAHVLPAARPRPPLRPAPPAARTRARLRATAALAVLGGSAAVVAVNAGAGWASLLALAVCGLGPIVGDEAWRGLGHAEARGVHHSRAGLFSRSTTIVPTARVQSASVVASLFQRRRSLATVRIDLAGGSARVVDRAHDDARSVATAALTSTDAPVARSSG